MSSLSLEMKMQCDVNVLIFSQETGSTVTDVLFGEYNPSRRIPFTIAKDDLEYFPVIYNTILEEQDNFTHSIFLDYRYYVYYNLTSRYKFVTAFLI